MTAGPVIGRNLTAAACRAASSSSVSVAGRGAIPGVGAAGRAPGLAPFHHLHKKRVRLPIDARGIGSQHSVPTLDLPALAVVIDDAELTLDFRRRVALGLKLLSVQVESFWLCVVSIEEFLRLRRLADEPESPELVDLLVWRPRSDALLEILDGGLLCGWRRL